MRTVTALLPVLLAVPPAAAAQDTSIGGGIDGQRCRVDSDYALSVSDRSVVFTREAGAPRAVVMRQGRLFVDGRWRELSPADRERIEAFERDARAAMPEAAQLGRDAADIAFTALSEVAAGFSSDPQAAQARYAKVRARLDARLAASVTATHFSADELGRGIADAVGEVIPSLLGDIVGGAISAAFSGDASRLQRLERLDAQIEAQVQPRARALEQRAQALCRRMQALDALEDALEVRIDGRALDLIEVDAAPVSAPSPAPNP